MEWSYHVGIPHEFRSDRGGSFRSRFTTMLKKVGINHVLTSLYNSKSNGGCERSVRSLKDCLKRDKVKNVTQQKLDELNRKLGVQEDELKRAIDRAELAEKNLKTIEEELQTVGDNMKVLEQSAEKAVARLEKLIILVSHKK